jgi:hypothetical protein
MGLGTVFGTFANGYYCVSDVFVYQGSVQVNESTGVAGTCARRPGRCGPSPPAGYKVAADFPETAARYRAVAEHKALRDPARRWRVRRIAALWARPAARSFRRPPPVRACGDGEQGRRKREEAISNRYRLSPIAIHKPHFPSVEHRASSAKTFQKPAAARHRKREAKFEGIMNTAAALGAPYDGRGRGVCRSRGDDVRLGQRGVRAWWMCCTNSRASGDRHVGFETNGVAIGLGGDAHLRRRSG